AQHLEQVVRPALARGAVVLCDRFSGSTIAYQGYGRGLDIDTVVQLDAGVRRGLAPSLTILLDCPVEEGLRRAVGDDRLHREALEFHRRVQEGFRMLAANDQHWVTIRSDQPAEVVAEQVVDAAHLLSLPAQNSLLKGLEEPPPGSLTVLITHNADALLPTVRSRCQRLLFAPLSDDQLIELLTHRLDVPADEARALAELA